MPITMTIECNNPDELLTYLSALSKEDKTTVSVGTAFVADNDAKETKQEEVDPPKKPRARRAKKAETVEAKAEPKEAEAKAEDEGDAPKVTLEMLRDRTIKLAAFAQEKDPDNGNARQECVKTLLSEFKDDDGEVYKGIGKIPEDQYPAFYKALDAKAAEMGMTW